MNVYWFLEEDPAKGPGIAPKAVVQDEPVEHADDQWVCAVCQCPVALASGVCVVNGQHSHRFMNPHGFVFDILCFREVLDCRDEGPPSTEHSWFPGFAWTITQCGGCGAQLGWAFESDAAPRFWGLIENRIVRLDARTTPPF